MYDAKASRQAAAGSMHASWTLMPLLQWHSRADFGACLVATVLLFLVFIASPAFAYRTRPTAPAREQERPARQGAGRVLPAAATSSARPDSRNRHARHRQHHLRELRSRCRPGRPRFLRSNELEDKVVCIVTFMGVPLRIARRRPSPQDQQEAADLKKAQADLRQKLMSTLGELELQVKQVEKAYMPLAGDEPAQLARRDGDSDSDPLAARGRPQHPSDHRFRPKPRRSSRAPSSSSAQPGWCAPFRYEAHPAGRHGEAQGPGRINAAADRQGPGGPSRATSPRTGPQAHR